MNIKQVCICAITAEVCFLVEVGIEHVPIGQAILAAGLMFIAFVAMTDISNKTQKKNHG